MFKNPAKLLVVLVVTGLIVALIAFLVPSRSSVPQIEKIVTQENKSLLESFQPVLFISFLKPGEHFAGENRICTTSGCVVGGEPRELQLSQKMKAVLTYKPDGCTWEKLCWETVLLKDGVPVPTPITFFEGLYFADDDSILTGIPVDEGDEYRYYDGHNWIDIFPMIMPALGKVNTNGAKSNEYFYFEGFDTESGISADGILKFKLSQPAQSEGVIVYTPSFYTFFLDLKTRKLLEVYRTDYDVSTKQSSSYNFIDNPEKFPNITDLF